MRFCIGTAQFGLHYGIQGNGQPTKKNVFDMLSYALHNGVEMLDTASAYGNAESILGEYIRIHPGVDGKVGIVSKLHPDAFQNGDERKWAHIAVDCARRSLDSLGIGKFFAYLAHNASCVFNKNAVLALNAVKETGRADRVGVSVYTPDEAMKALEYPQIEAIQLPYNLFDHRLDKRGFIKEAREKKITVFARSSLLQGLLVMDPDKLPERVLFAKPYLEKYHALCLKYNVSPLDAAIGYVGSKEWIGYIVFGVDNMSQLEGYIEMKGHSLPPEMVEEIDSAYENVEERLVNPVLWK